MHPPARRGIHPRPTHARHLWEGTLRLWDLANGETLRTLEGHTNWVRAVAVLGDGRGLLVALWKYVTAGVVIEGVTMKVA